MWQQIIFLSLLKNIYTPGPQIGCSLDLQTELFSAVKNLILHRPRIWQPMPYVFILVYPVSTEFRLIILFYSAICKQNLDCTRRNSTSKLNKISTSPSIIKTCEMIYIVTDSRL
ncbi:hypothetical protein M758_12G092200 [Ceratodon purpureus]|nr:hypothetical protein M758_12G092200 [Ceratodon purpureus]